MDYRQSQTTGTSSKYVQQPSAGMDSLSLAIKAAQVIIFFQKLLIYK